MGKPRALDLFCCAGGAGMGLHRAGFEVVGVDIRPQPNYPFEFHQADALEYSLDGFDFIWASPPCQGYSSHVSSRSSQFVPTKGKDEPRLIAAIRERLVASGTHWAIENVVGARGEMDVTLTLCGSMFGLPIARHRVISTSFFIFHPPHESCRGIAKRYAAARGWEYRDMSVTGKGRRKGTSLRWSEIMGIDWPMRQAEMSEAIPPAYSEFIGRAALAHLDYQRAAA
jgi:DNA (cytosine-5)-methyltransferase 1